jgi:two-component system response regulator AtoC
MSDKPRDDVPSETRTEPLAGSAAGATPPKPRGVTLMIYYRDGVKAVPLAPDQALVVGRHKLADVPIPDQMLSAKHARFTLREDRIFVEDLGSTNGTWVAKKRIEHDMLELSGEVMLGTVIVRVVALGMATDPAIEGGEAFRNRLDEEVTRAQHFDGTFAVLAVRITNGEAQRAHPVAWTVQLRANLRSVDRVSFYTPTLVLILLPEMGAEEALQVARVIAKSAAAQDGPRLVGVAVYPEAASTAEKLVDLAREAASRARPERPVRAASIAIVNKNHVAAANVMIAGKALEKLLDDARRVSTASLPVILHGETGTGKEVLAHFIHKHGPRHSKRLVCVNCGAIQGSLVESTLFGHEKGSFTSAVQQQRGVFEDADKTTLFLDEIGELPLTAQTALLRVIETGTFSRVGSTQEVAVDVRIIAATHRDLEKMVQEGTFREDLYYRLNVVVLEIPPLRERLDEIEPLAQRFLANANKVNGRNVQGFTEEAKALLLANPWPGNVRQLRNVVDRAVVMGRGDQIYPEDLRDPHPFAQRGTVTTTGADLKVRQKQEQSRNIETALEKANGNCAEAAKQLGMAPRTLTRRIKELGVRKPPKK